MQGLESVRTEFSVFVETDSQRLSSHNCSCLESSPGEVLRVCMHMIRMQTKEIQDLKETVSELSSRAIQVTADFYFVKV